MAGMKLDSLGTPAILSAGVEDFLEVETPFSYLSLSCSGSIRKVKLVGDT